MLGKMWRLCSMEAPGNGCCRPLGNMLKLFIFFGIILCFFFSGWRHSFLKNRCYIHLHENQSCFLKYCNINNYYTFFFMTPWLFVRLKLKSNAVEQQYNTIQYIICERDIMSRYATICEETHYKINITKKIYKYLDNKQPLVFLPNSTSY